MRRSKRLLIDVLMFAISNFGSKVLTFLMVPLYTYILTTDEYGIADLMMGTVNIVLPVLTLAISEATLRFLLDDNTDNGKVLGGSLLLIGVSFSILLISGTFIGRINVTLGDYWGYFLALYLATALSGCLSNYVRGIEKTHLFAIKGVLHTLILVVLNLLFLLVFHMGLHGYLLAMIISDVVVILFMMISSKIWKVIPEITLDRSVIRQMLQYSIPMIPTIIAWWTMQMSDKYILIAFSGIAVSGIYAAAYRIPSLLSMVSSIFNQAWQISAVKSLKDDDYSQYVIQVYQYFFATTSIVCSILIAGAQLIGKFMFLNDYYIAWTYVPVLLIAYFLSGLSGVMASIFTTMKRTFVLLYSTLSGSVVNIVLNFILIPRYGAMAAAFTTAVGFLLTFIIRSCCTKCFFNIKLNGLREFVLIMVLCVQAYTMSADVHWKIPIQIFCLAAIVAAYRKEIIICLKKGTVDRKK